MPAKESCQKSDTRPWRSQAANAQRQLIPKATRRNCESLFSARPESVSEARRENGTSVENVHLPGKTCLCQQFLQEKFLFEHKETVDEMHRYELPSLDGQLTLEILDTAGIEEFPVMRRLAIAHGDAFLILYAPNDLHSFHIAEQMHDLIVEIKGDEPTPLVVVANKSDVQSNDELKRIVEERWHRPLVETSCHQRDSVVNAFRTLLQLAEIPLPNNIDIVRRSSDPSVSLSSKRKSCVQQ